MLRAPGIIVTFASVSACALMIATGAPAAPATPESRIKAGIVYNLALVVSWPDSALSAGTFTVGVAGHDESDPDLAHLAGKDVRRRQLVLRDPLPPNEVAGAQIVYVSRSHETDLGALLGQLAGRPVLTVSDLDGFCEAGGMVQLRRDRNRFLLRVNRAAAEQAGLRLSSELLKVAELMEGGD